MLSLVTFAYLARTLEPERFGILGIGIALLGYFSLPVNLGLNVLGTRELARDHDRAADLASAIVSMRLVLVLVTLLAYLGVVSLLDKPLLFKTVLAAQGFSLFGQAISLEWVYQGVERMGVLAVRNAAVAVLALLGTLLFVRSPDDVVAAALVSVFALVAANGWLIGAYCRDFGRVRLRVDIRAWLRLSRPALPILASQVMISVFVSLDTLLLGFFRGEEAAGWYAAIYKLLAAVLIPSDILIQAFLPSLSHVYGTFAAMQERSRTFAKLLFSLGLPISLGGAILATDLVNLVYGPAYQPAAGALAILLVNALFVYANSAYGHPLIAWNRERSYMLAFSVGAVLNVLLDLLLIPKYGINGAAIGTLVCQAVVTIILATLHVRVAHQLYLGSFGRLSIVAGIGVGVPLALDAVFDWPLFVTIGVSATAYCLIVYHWRLITLDMFNSPEMNQKPLPGMPLDVAD
jgi:O-antigen/teichoic acid export membrane protein